MKRTLQLNAKTDFEICVPLGYEFLWIVSSEPLVLLTMTREFRMFLLF